MEKIIIRDWEIDIVLEKDQVETGGIEVNFHLFHKTEKRRFDNTIFFLVEYTPESRLKALEDLVGKLEYILQWEKENVARIEEQRILDARPVSSGMIPNDN